MFSVVRDALNLDIWDMNYTNVHTHPAILKNGGELHLPKGVLKRIGGFFYHFILGIGTISPKSQCTDPGAIFFFVTSQNQAHSLRPLLPYLDKTCWCKDRNQVKDGYPFPSFWAHFISLFFIPMVIVQFWRGRKTHDIGIQSRYGMDRYLLTYGYYVVARLWLRRHAPKAVVIANDAIIYLRTVAQAAKDEQIATFYLQHASITERFPPLMCDYALLDGIDALETYAAIGESDTTVFLIGMPKFDKAFGAINTHPTVSAVGICVNMLDSIERVEELCALLQQRFPDLRKYLRPHPRETRTGQWRQLGKRYGFTISDPGEEDSFGFLQKIDVMLADNSSIHVEAALLNVYPIQYSFSGGGMTPTYGFIERGLCDSLTDPAAVCDLLAMLVRDKPDIRARAIPYCATIGTAYDGQSCQLAGSIIESLAGGGSFDREIWRPIPDMSLTSYEPGQKVA